MDEILHYFDYAATTPLCPQAKDALTAQLDETWFNPSGQYAPSHMVSKKLISYKSTLATALGCKGMEFSFTSGGTESNNWAITQGVYHNRHKGRHCITTAVEHSSVKKVFQHLEKQGYRVTYLQPNQKGEISPQQVVDALEEDTIFVSVMMVNNETGILFDVGEMARQVKAQNPTILFHTDAIQGFLKVPFSLAQGPKEGTLAQVDLLSISGHKVFAPKGIGGLFIRQGLQLTPLLWGGGQENGLRSGTEATHQIASFSAAVAEGYPKQQDSFAKIQALKEELLGALPKIPHVSLILSPDVATAPHILPFTVEGYPSQVMLTYLSEKGIYLSAGSACHRGGDSPVFALFPLNPREKAGALRLSLSSTVTSEDVTALLQGLESGTQNLLPML